eukprot:CAMPEP_0117618672 /NCGR_PEP_ID=MMETSP0784-20121206/86222_1 /TAXON_ID=39447 /ORGANISM="" /LENGTH=886 /DNA_ID=CAMNT_0005422539 /DNA_START=36 /DNA_END=2696 /DNA_ORIENTATION=+
MKVLSEAKNLVNAVGNHAIDLVVGQRSVRIFVSNATQEPISFADEPFVQNGTCTVSFDCLERMRAGLIHLSADGEVGGAVALTVGQGDQADVLRLGGKCPREPGFAVEVSSGLQDNRRASTFSISGLSSATNGGVSSRALRSFCQAIPRSVMGSNGKKTWALGQNYAALVVDAIYSGNSIVAHVIVTTSAIAGEDSGAVAPVCLLEACDAPAMLAFVQTCLKRGKIELAKMGTFVMELAAITGGMNYLDVGDRAFTLHLLIQAFVMHNVVSLPAGALEREFKAMKESTPPQFADDLKHPQHDVYAKASPESLVSYLDNALVLCKSVALHCAEYLQLASSPSGPVPDVKPLTAYVQSAVPRPGRCCSCPGLRRQGLHRGSVSGEEPSQQGQIMREHLSSGEENSFSQVDKVEYLKKLVALSVEDTCLFSMALDQLFEQLTPAGTAESAQAALRHYRDWMPGARRRFVHESSGSRGPVVFETWGAEVFGRLYATSGLGAGELVASLGSEAPPCRTLSTNSKSGEFFFFSSDQRFLVKTISEDEARVLFRMLPEYQSHMRRVPRSTMVRYASLIRMSVDSTSWTYFSIMRSVFDPACSITETYDVKGSLFKRHMKKGEKVGKDADWADKGLRLELEDSVRRELRAAHEEDANFLKRFGVMDYSLLIGIHRLEKGETGGTGWREGGGVWDRSTSTVYFVGLIDFLISYGLKKKAEHVLRVMQFHGTDASCVDPTSYAIRQVSFVRDSVFAPAGVSGTPLGVLGTLRVTVMAAHGLRNADVLSLSDPYVVVQIGLQRQRTPTLDNTLDPVWDCVLTFALDRGHLDMNVELVVWDHDSLPGEGGDDHLGTLLVPLRRIVEESPLQLQAVPLEGVDKGELSVRLEIEPMPCSA